MAKKARRVYDFTCDHCGKPATSAVDWVQRWYHGDVRFSVTDSIGRVVRWDACSFSCVSGAVLNVTGGRS